MTNNGGTSHLTQQFQIHANQKNGSITTITNTSEAISPANTCDKQLVIEMVSITDQNDKLPLSSIVNTNNHQCTVSPDPRETQDHQFTALPSDATESASTYIESGDRELTFPNLELQCMCSDDNASEISKADPIRSQLSGDDETDIEISYVESVTDVGESIIQTHRCTHCGRGHCCFFLRCCYCTASGLYDTTDLTTDNIANSSAIYENNPCQNESDVNRTENINNVPNHLVLGESVATDTKQNTASKRCVEICKMNSSQPEKKQCCEDVFMGHDNQSTVNKLIASGCHCRWYCIKDCDLNVKSGAGSSDSAGNRAKNTTSTEQGDKARTKLDNSLAVQKPQIVSPFTNEYSLNDENRLRCCRCSKELF